jgi:hypothetical protein
MSKQPINFNTIKNLKELHQLLKSRKIKLEAECSMEEFGQPTTFVKNHTISQRTLTDQTLRFLRRSSVVKFNRGVNAKPPFIDEDLLKEYEEDKDILQLRMLVDDDIQAGVARVYKKTNNNRKIIDALYSSLDLIFHTPELNKVLEAYIKPNFSRDQITTCVNEIKKSNQLQCSLGYDDELRPKLVKWAIEDGYSLVEELMDFCSFTTNGYCKKTHKILMLPLIEFLLSHFKELEVWEISNDTTYYVIARPYFFIGIFGYTHDGQFDGVVYKGVNE